MTTQWNHRTAKVNGINIHYVTYGQGSPVILLHGWPEFWYGWRRVIPVLAEQFQVIAPDMRGFGYSDKPLSGYDSRTVADDIYLLARSLGHLSVALVGHDIGVRIAYRYTLDHEGEVARLALLDGPPPTENLGPMPAEVVRERWHSYFHAQPDLPERLVGSDVEAYLRHMFRDWSINKYLFTDEEVAEYVKACSQPGALRGASATTVRRFTKTHPTGWPKPTASCPTRCCTFGVRAERGLPRSWERTHWGRGERYSPTPAERTWESMATFSRRRPRTRSTVSFSPS